MGKACRIILLMVRLGHRRGVREYCACIMGVNVCYEYQLFAFAVGSMWK
jgi:hypothetical protein